MKPRYRIVKVENVITEESSRRGDYASTDASDEMQAGVREALEALNSDCWDNVDFRVNSIICYPADYRQDFRTGDYEGTEVIIRGNEKDLERLLSVWEAQKKLLNRSAIARLRTWGG